MDGNNEYAIGLDLGGTKILAALVDSGGTIVERTELKTPAHQGEGAISQQINAAVGSILEKKYSAQGTNPRCWHCDGGGNRHGPIDDCAGNEPWTEQCADRQMDPG